MMLVPGSMPRIILSLLLRGSVGESCTVFCYIYLYMLLKNRNRFGVALKVAIVFLAAFYIVWKLGWKPHVEFSFEKIADGIDNHLFVFFTVIFLMPVNWFLEAIKWKLITSTKIKISLKESLQGVLAGVTIGTATPNRVGEFAGRIFMIKGDRMELLLLSFISSFCQVFVTILAGILSFVIMGYDHSLFTPVEFYLLIAIGIIFCTLPVWIKFLPARWIKKIKVISDFSKKKLIQALFISAIRYLVYVCQFLLLLYMFPDVFNLTDYFCLIMISYFIVTIIPTFSFTEVLVRGTVAGTIFGSYNEQVLPLAFGVAVLLWTINVAIPSLIGSVFVLKLKFFRPDK
jgi:uncharacterized membrane protein YbhN (UPF0104 family)